jgi:hypothetical protein
LVEKGLVDPAALDAIVEYYEHKVGPRNGARVVARAWADPAYKARLLTDATAAIAELGYSGLQGEHMVAVENAEFQGENAQPLYTVKFTARTLWGEAANPHDTVCLDLWEDYLDRA